MLQCGPLLRAAILAVGATQELGIMSRSRLFDLCELRLSTLCAQVQLRGRLNVLNLHTHCEDFFVHLLNRLLGYQLSNLNAASQNAQGVDLVDDANKIVIQVSATASKQKVNAALGKNLKPYQGYTFKFVPIVVNASIVAKQSFDNPHGLVFDPQTDILDITALLRLIKSMSLTDQQEILEILKAELDEESSRSSPTHLADVIRIIAAENLVEAGRKPVATVFNIDDKLIVNQLEIAAAVIEDYKIHCGRVDGIYAEFDSSGRNKSKSILDSFRNVYLKRSLQFSGDELFFQIVDDMVENVLASSNYVQMALEELHLCVNVLAVDAFIRCKIFKAPAVAGHAAT